MMQRAKINAVADIPTAVAVIVRHTDGRRRIVIAIHTFADTVRIFLMHGFDAHAEHPLDFVAQQKAMRLARGSGTRLVDERDENVGRMRANVPLHQARLANNLQQLITPHGGEHRHVGLEHEAEPVAPLVNLLVDGALREAQEIHVRQFREKNVLAELVEIILHHAPFEMAHRVCAAQTNFTSVQKKFTFGRGIFVLLERSHAELLFRGVEQIAGHVEQLHLRLIKPRHFKIPDVRVRQRELNGNVISSQPHACGNFLGVIAIEIAKAAHGFANGTMRLVEMHGCRKILTKDGDEQVDFFARILALIFHLDADFHGLLLDERAHPEIANLHVRAALDGDAIVNAHAGRTMMPAEHRLVVAKSGGGINLIAIYRRSVLVTAEHREIILDADEQNIPPRARDTRAVEFKFVKESLVLANANVVEINLTLVIHASETQRNTFARKQIGR